MWIVSLAAKRNSLQAAREIQNTPDARLCGQELVDLPYTAAMRSRVFGA
jgi:hypothetical protein